MSKEKGHKIQLTGHLEGSMEEIMQKYIEAQKKKIAEQLLEHLKKK